MLNWLSQNIPTLITGAAVLALVAVAVLSLVRNRKQGKSSCGCNCSGCAMAATCHSAPMKKGTDGGNESSSVKTVLKIDGMMCGMCEAHINDAIRAAFPVQKVSSSHTKGETEILSACPLDEEKLREVIRSTGYRLVSVSFRP